MQWKSISHQLEFGSNKVSAIKTVIIFSAEELMEAGLRAFVPEISRIGANMTPQAHERIAAINRRAMKLIIICGVPVFGILFTFAPVLLKFWLQKSFVDMCTFFLYVTQAGESTLLFLCQHDSGNG
jgi:hypothetical protein